MSATIEITVKTLDSQNHKFDVAEELTIKEFKEKIADVVNVSVESQRLIYCGRVLQDEKKLTDYGLDKKVVHLVQKVPPSQSRAQSSGTSTANPRSTTGSSRRSGASARSGGDGSMYLGALAFPSDIFSMQGTNDIIQNAAQSRLTLVQSMLRRLETCLVRLENPNRSSESTAETTTAAEDTSNVGSDEERSFEAELDRAFTSSVNTHEHIAEVAADATADAVAGAVSSAIAGALSAIVSAVGNTMGAPNITIVQEAGHDQAHPGTTNGAAQSTTAQTPPTVASTPSADPDPAGQAGHPGASATGSTGLPSEQRRQGGSTIPLSTLADVLDQAGSLQERLRPHMQSFSQMLRSDPVLPSGSRELAEAQGNFALVSEAMHLFSHAYHSLSDLSVGLSRPPPRQVGVSSLWLQPAAVVQGFPIQAQINVMTNRVSPTSAGPHATSPTRQSMPPRMQPSASSENATTPPTVHPMAGHPGREGVRPPFTLSPGGNLELIMEVGPGGITFERATPPTTSANASSENLGARPGNGPPPEIIQNIMQAMAAQIMGGGRVTQMTGRGGVIGTPAPVTTSNSTTTTNAAGGNQAGAPGQTSQARGNTATHPTTATQTRSTSRPHVHLAPVNWPGPQGFDPFLPCNSHHSQIPSGRRQLQVVQGPSSVHRIHIPNQQTPGHPAAFRTPAGLVSIAQQILGDNSEVNLMNLQPGATVADFLQAMPDYNYSRGESLFSDLFFTIAQNFTFRDLVQVSLQQSTPLNRLRQPLRTFVNEQLLSGEPPSQENVSRAVDRIMTELQPYLEVVNSTQLRQDIDYEASIRQLSMARLPEVIRLIVSEDGEVNEFGAQLMHVCGQYARDLASLTLLCCHGGRQGLERILHRYVQVLTGDMEPTVQQWTSTNSRIPLRNFVESLSTPETLDVYMVRSQASAPFPATAPASSPVSATKPPTQQEIETHINDQEEAMDFEEEFVLALEDPVQETTPRAPSATEVEMVERAMIVRPNASLSLPRMQVDTNCDVAVGSEEWHTGLNPDWVPVITRDIQRQRRQQSEQPPFSDAYLSGMSSKRRKLIANSKPQGTVSQVISDSLTQAAGAAGIATTEHLTRAAGADATLQAAYKKEVKNAVGQQLASNPDFTPERYPNASKYFGSPK